MPQVIVKYKKPETLKMLKSLSKYLGFEVSPDENKAKNSFDDILVPGNKSLDLNALRDIFTGKDINVKELRQKAWKR